MAANNTIYKINIDKRAIRNGNEMIPGVVFVSVSASRNEHNSSMTKPPTTIPPLQQNHLTKNS